MNLTVLEANKCYSSSSGAGDGGARLRYFFFNDKQVELSHFYNNHIVFSSVVFSSIEAYFGGAFIAHNRRTFFGTTSKHFIY